MNNLQRQRECDCDSRENGRVRPRRDGTRSRLLLEKMGDELKTGRKVIVGLKMDEKQ